MAERIHIYAPQPSFKRAFRKACPVCGKRSVILGFWVEWYGWELTCLRCGDEWCDGQLAPRPFMPKWREKNKQSARLRWRTTLTGGQS